MGFIFVSVLWDAAAILSVLAAFLYHYLTSTHSFWEKLNVPYVKPKIFYGNMREVVHFRRTQVETMMDFYYRFKNSGHKFGGIFQLRKPVLLVCHPEMVKNVSIKDFPYFHDRFLAYDEHFDPLSAHLLAIEGQKWKFLRSKLSPAFSTSKLKGMLSIVKGISQDFMEILGEAANKGEMVEMRKSCSLFMIDVIGAVAFGLRVNAQREESEFLHVGQRFIEPTKWEILSQIVVNTYPWLYKMFKMKIISTKVTEFFIGVVRDMMEHRRKNNIEQNDFLHFLMKIKEEKGANLKDLEEMKGVDGYNMTVNEKSIELTEGVIAAQAFIFFLAGYETSSTTLSTCIHILADHPDIQDKLLEEVDKTLQKYGDLTYEAAQNLIYFEQVLEETLRMYPPATLIFRKCTKRYQIPGTSVVLPEGCHVFIPVYSFHHDPEYFPEPQEFRPERFSPENRPNLVPYSFMPFGHGPRVCIGARLAMMEMKMALAMMIKKFKIVKCEKSTPFRMDPMTFLLTPADGLWVRLINRKE